MTSRRSAIPALLMLTCAVALVAAPSSAADDPVTCRGLEATHVGVPGEVLTTTSGDDVVVTNAARSVSTLGGDDVICVTRARQVDVVPGAGDDVVDTTGFHGVQVDADLGEAGAEGSSGDDTYIGGAQWDEIDISSGTAADHKDIATGDHFDYLYVYGGYHGTLTADLGTDNDSFTSARPRAGVSVDGGGDYDDYYTLCARCDTFTADLGAGALQVDGTASGSAVGFEYFRVFHQRHRMVREATVTGSDDSEFIDIAACATEIHGAGGNDNVGSAPVPRLCPDGIRSQVSGDDGDDYVIGTVGRDVLRGGAGDDRMLGGAGRDDLGGWTGRDRADGGAGRDRCRAEVKESCEA